MSEDYFDANLGACILSDGPEPSVAVAILGHNPSSDMRSLGHFGSSGSHGPVILETRSATIPSSQEGLVARLYAGILVSKAGKSRFGERTKPKIFLHTTHTSLALTEERILSVAPLHVSMGPQHGGTPVDRIADMAIARDGRNRDEVDATIFIVASVLRAAVTQIDVKDSAVTLTCGDIAVGIERFTLGTPQFVVPVIPDSYSELETSMQSKEWLTDEALAGRLRAWVAGDSTTWP